MTRSRLVVGFLAAQAALLGFSAATHSPMMDEIAHLGAGIRNWELGTYGLYKVNPPLIRMLAMSAGAKTDYGNYSPGEATHAEFRVMGDFVRPTCRCSNTTTSASGRACPKASLECFVEASETSTRCCLSPAA